MIVKGYVFSILYVLLCVAGSMILHKFGVPKKYTRKFVHILVGFEWPILYYFFGASLHFLAVCVLFTFLLIVDYKVKLLPAMSSDDDNAPGTVYYALAMTVLAFLGLFSEEIMLPFGIGVFSTSLGDGFAGVVGQAITRNNPKIYKSKSCFGTLTNLVVSFLTPLVFSRIYGYPLEIWHCIIIAIFAAELEMFIAQGLDNIFITILVALISFGFVYYPMISDYILPILITPAIIALSYTKKALTLGGVALAVVMDLIISLSLKNFGFAILITFFVGSIIVDKIKKHRKKSGQNQEDVEKRGDCRDIVQVFANGGVATLAALIYIFVPEKILVITFVAALAEAFADTVASGLGAFSDKVYDIFRRERCERGVSGGMSLIGTFSSLLAALFVAVVAYLFGAVSLAELLLIGGAGFLGNVFDSFLGSFVQVKFKCKKCGKIIEKEEHCGVKTEHYRGLKFVNNDTVNFLGTLFAGALAAVIYILI